MGAPRLNLQVNWHLVPKTPNLTLNRRKNRMATATITPDQDAVVAEIFIAAPPARVFQAISDPNQLPR